jgi:hypothetical protein
VGCQGQHIAKQALKAMNGVFMNSALKLIIKVREKALFYLDHITLLNYSIIDI